MAFNVFEMFAKLSLDSSDFQKSVDGVKGAMEHVTGAAKSLVTGTISAIGDLAKKGINAASSALTGFIKSSVQTGQSFEQAIAGVSATLGQGSEEVIGQLRDFAKEMGATTKYTATQAAQALNYMALAGYNAEVSMEMLPNVMNLATAGAMDLAKASDVLTDAASAFGLDVAHNEEDLKRVNTLIDEMAKAASTGNTNVEQLGDAFLTIGGLAKELNGRMVTLADGTTKEADGLVELQTALVAMANAGVKGSEAGTHMRNMITKLSNPTDKATEALEDMGVAIFDDAGKMKSLTAIFTDLNAALSTKTQEERIKTISELFNARDLASAQALLGAINGNWQDIERSILDADGAASAMVEKQINTLEGQRTIMTSAIDGLKIAISEGINPVLKEFATLGAGAFSDFVASYNNKGIEGIFGKLDVWVPELMKKVKQYLPQVMTVINQFFASVFKHIPGILQTLIPEILNSIGEFIDMMTSPEMMRSLIDGGAKLLETLLQGVLNSWSKLGEVALRLVTSLADYLEKNAGEMASSAAEMVAEFARNLKENNTLSKLVSAAVRIAKALADALLEPDTLTTIIQAGIDILIALAQGIGENLGPIFDALGQIVNEILTWVTTPENVEMILTAGMEIILKLVDGLKEAAGQVLEFILGLAEDIADYFGFGDYWRAGMDVIDEFMGGVMEKWNKWKGFWEGVGEYIYDSLHDEEGNTDWSNYWAKAASGEGQDTSAQNDPNAPRKYSFGNNMSAREYELYEQARDKLGNVPSSAVDEFNARWLATHPGVKAATTSAIQAPTTNTSAMMAEQAANPKKAPTTDTTAAYYEEAAKRARGYATGGIVTKPTYSLIGEAGAEAVVPLEHNTGWIDRVADRIRENNGGITVQNLTIDMNGVTLSDSYETQQMVRDIVRSISEEMRVLQVNEVRATGGAGWR